jgi:hypothetical protein
MAPATAEVRESAETLIILVVEVVEGWDKEYLVSIGISPTVSGCLSGITSSCALNVPEGEKHVCQGVLTISMRDFGVCRANRTVNALKLPENEHLTPLASGLFDSFIPPPDREFQEPAFQVEMKPSACTGRSACLYNTAHLRPCSAGWF